MFVQNSLIKMKVGVKVGLDSAPYRALKLHMWTGARAVLLPLKVHGTKGCSFRFIVTCIKRTLNIYTQWSGPALPSYASIQNKPREMFRWTKNAACEECMQWSQLSFCQMTKLQNCKQFFLDYERFGIASYSLTQNNKTIIRWWSSAFQSEVVSNPGGCISSNHLVCYRTIATRVDARS